MNSRIIQIGIERAMKSGYRTIYSSALMDHEIGGFLKCGFTVKEQLHVLRHSLAPTASSQNMEDIRIRKPIRSDLEYVVQLDEKCFDSFWTMDVAGLQEAIEATTRARFRIALYPESKSETIAGYAITGLGDKKGYLQRLAVDPDYQGRGIAQQLVQDGFGWLRFWRAREEYVNTQTKNERALNFYLKMGFTLLQERLNILEVDLGA
ncbi:MAG: GNAT family N-acetyltransferase [Actinomycetota bacterium]|nr:MAG: GNAT family N-acetyltransferase [Actinomycetota bacterium]